MSARRILLDCFDAALRAVHGRACVGRFLRGRVVGEAVDVFAIGKAATAMALGARDTLGPALRRTLVITKKGHSDPALHGPDVLQLEGPHPMPDIRSLSHGQALEAGLRTLPAMVTPLFLVSGGSSSIVEVLREEVSLDDLVALNARGLAGGWEIAKFNAERVKLSRLKGGGVARLLGDRVGLALFISDVPGDDPGVIGSGLLGRADTAADRIERHVVANSEDAVRAACEAGQARGLAFEARAARFDGEAADVARRFVDELRHTNADGLVWGGEATVRLPARYGRGGRNMHLALAAARLLRAGETMTILAAGTDGTDGPTDDAGAIVDAHSLERADLAGVDVERAWREFDSATALEAAEDLVHTGPTGTNVGDILIGIRHESRRSHGREAARVL